MPFQRARVLLIEYDRPFAIRLRETLEHLDADVLTADGASGLPVDLGPDSRATADLILVGAPGQAAARDGWVADAVRHARMLPVVAITARRGDDVIDAIDEGASDAAARDDVGELFLRRTIALAVGSRRARAWWKAHAAGDAAVVTVGRRVIEAADLDSLLEETVAVVAQTLGASCAGVFETAGGGRWLRLRCGVGWGAAVPEVSTSEPAVAAALAGGAAVALPEAWRALGLESGIAASLGGESRSAGVLVAASTQPRRFVADDALLLAQFATVVAAALSRRQAEEAFQASEAGYRFILDSASEGIWALDALGRTTYVNRRAAEMLGYSPTELTGRPVSEFVFEADDGVVPRLLGQQNGSAEHPFDCRLRCRDGSELWVLASANPIFDPQGAFAGALGMFTDVTARRRAEAALQQSEERYRRIVETANEGIWVFDARGRTEYVNRVMAALLGFRVDEMFGRSLADFVFEDDVADAVRRVERGRSGVRDQAEIRLRRRDGGEVWVLASSSPIAGDGDHPAGLLLMSIDVTGRRQAEAERLRLISAVEQAAEAVFRTSPDGTILYVNPAFERITGYTAGEVIGQTPRILKAPSTGRSPGDELWRTIRSGRVWRGEMTNRRKDGSLYTWEETVTPVRGDKGDVVEYIAICQDTSDRRDLEDRLRQSQKMEAIGRLAGGVAHDFNNLLTVITGYSERLLAQLDADDARRKAADAIKRAADRAAALTHQLLAFSRRQVLAPKIVDLNTIVGAMHKLLRRLIGEDVELVTVAGADLWPVKADPNQFEQVIMNLAVNSRDAMPRGGVLRIETANVDLDAEFTRHHVGLQPGAYVMLAVSDTGCGMDEHTLGHLFEPFFTTKEQGKGTGLGLSTIYGIVKQSGGYIWVESEPGRGATFRVYLPREHGDVEAPSVPAAAATVPRGWETVLLVEDEEAVRLLLRDILRRFGYVVVDAASGPEAIEIADRHDGAIHLLLTDMVMPHMNGWEVAETVMARRPGIKVIYMSGYIEHAIPEHRVIEAGIAFLGKPFSPDALGWKVREVLNQHIES